MTPTERDLFRRRANQARRLGRDLFEFLDQRGYLVTGSRAAEIKSDAMRQVANQLESMSISEIVRRYGSGANNALDAQAGLVALIRDMARKEGQV